MQEEERNYGFTPLAVNSKKFDIGLIRLSGVICGVYVSVYPKGHWWFAPKWWTLL